MRRIGIDTIWKFPVTCEDDWVLEMPAESVPLSVAVQNGQPFLWAAVDSQTQEKERHRFHLRATGQPLGDGVFHRFIGTFVIELAQSLFVFHLFDGGAEGQW